MFKNPAFIYLFYKVLAVLPHIGITTRSGKKYFSFKFQYFWMTSVGIKSLSENSQNHFGANKIKMASFQHGFIDLAPFGNFCCFFKMRIKTDVSFSTTLSDRLRCWRKWRHWQTHCSDFTWFDSSQSTAWKKSLK